MTTSTSTRFEAQGSPTWVLWLIGIALIILFIWLRNTASNAKSTAEANASLLAVDLCEIGDGETALVFLGFDPAALPQEVADGWMSHCRNSRGTFAIEAGDFRETLYGRGV